MMKLVKIIGEIKKMKGCLLLKLMFSVRLTHTLGIKKVWRKKQDFR